MKRTKSRLICEAVQTRETGPESNDKFNALLTEIYNLHNKKKADYTNENDRFSNFKVAALYSGIETFQSIENLIGVKQARLLELRNPKNPTRPVNNEPIRDTLIDRAVYSLLAVLWYDEEKK